MSIRIGHKLAILYFLFKFAKLDGRKAAIWYIVDNKKHYQGDPSWREMIKNKCYQEKWSANTLQRKSKIKNIQFFISHKCGTGWIKQSPSLCYSKPNIPHDLNHRKDITDILQSEQGLFFYLFTRLKWLSDAERKEISWEKCVHLPSQILFVKTIRSCKKFLLN